MGRSCCHFLELVPAKGLPQCAAISPRVKGYGLRCPYSPGRLKQSDHTIPLPGTDSVLFSGTRDACPYRGGGGRGATALPLRLVRTWRLARTLALPWRLARTLALPWRLARTLALPWWLARTLALPWRRSRGDQVIRRVEDAAPYQLED